jgi:ACS family glucarate transporter-like MFS transporter
LWENTTYLWGGQATKYRNRVLGLLSLLMVITYLDRVCISVAGPRMQEDLHIGAVGWGWVTGVFAFAYAVFEIPTGALGDRIGPRRVITRIVLWWSAFTSLTGAITGYYPLLATRFFFGMGEAGAFPNASVAVARWFPVRERGRAFGIILMASQIGGAIAPLLVVPIQMRYGWRASFYAFGFLGVAWSVIWYRWFRDSPAEKAGITKAELEETRDLVAKADHSLPWGIALRSGNLWAVMAVAFCYVYSFFFFQSWFHTYLVKGRGYSESGLLLSTLPFLVAACANGSGGIVSNALVRRLGLKWGRRSIGLVGLASAAMFAVAVLLTKNNLLALIFLSLLYGGITLQQPAAFAVCLDIGGEYAGAVTGAFNTASQVGSLVSSVVFGYLVDHYGNYNAPFIPMALLLCIGALLWFKIDPTLELIPASRIVPLG